MSSTSALAPLPAASAELRLIVRCHEHVLALGAAVVDRILLADEVDPPVPAATFDVHPNVPPACLGVLRAAGTVWAAWDMAMLLELPPVSAAYLLLHQPYEGGTLRLALRSDRCLHVGRLPDVRVLRLAAGIARARPGLLRGAFPMSPLNLRQQGEVPVGLDLDLRELWSEPELGLARALLSRAEAPAPRGDDGTA